ncbi:MAG: TonB-dependent receptor plug domain-containing protein [Ignavibacteriales bacterium]|nr:TonB-dependent receptor plug domain-containing protein [Ignavibacteriales bacterium]
MTVSRFSLLYLFFFIPFVFSQEQTDSVASPAKRDSIIYVTPIPEIGSIRPFDSTFTKITAGNITWEEYRSLYDILSVQPGVFVRDLASPGQQNQIMTGGLYDRHIAIMIDGVPYNDFHTGSFNLWLIPVDAIERIEYIGNSQSIFYDGRSGAAAINIITKSYDNNRAITNLRYSQGVSGYTHTDAFFAQNIARDLNLTLALTHHGFGSNKESQNFRGRFLNSNDDAWSFRSKMRYNFTDWFDISFFYLYNKTWTGLHGGIDYFNTPSIFDGLQAEVQNYESYEKYSNSHYTITAAFFPAADSSVLATLSLYHFDRLREYRDEENRGFVTNEIFTKRDFASITNGVKFQITSQIGFNTVYGYVNYEDIGSERIIATGIKDHLSLLSFLTLSPFAVARDFSGNKLVHAGAEATLQLTSSLALFAGITEEIANDRGVKTNAITNLFLFNPANLQNRESYSIMEIGGSVSLPSVFNGSISYRRTVQKNPLEFDTSSTLLTISPIIPNKFSYDAIAASAHLTIGEFHLEGNGNYLKQPSIVRNNVSLTWYPEVTLYGSVYFHGLLAKDKLDLKIGIRGRYYSKQTGMKPYDEVGVWMPSSIIGFGPSGTMDFFAIGKIGSAYVHFIWENLTANHYLLAPVYPMYDGNIRFGLSWEFLD